MHWYTELWKALKSLGFTNEFSSCEVNALKINKVVQGGTNINKINNKLKFLYQKNILLALRQLLCNALIQPLCNALIQPCFDYAC